MKSKRYLAALLSVVMLVSSWSVWILAEGDDGDSGDPAAAGEQTDSIDALTEGEYYSKSGLDYGDVLCVTFAPETTGKYSFMTTNAYDVDVAVTDTNGTAILPIKTQKSSWSEIVDLQLTAGTTYMFSATASIYASAEPVTCVIFKTLNQFSVGKNSFASRLGVYPKYTFTPTKSGAYLFEAIGKPFRGNEYASLNMTVYSGETIISQYLKASDLDRYSFALLEAGVTYDIVLYCSGGDSFCGAFDVIISQIDTSLTVGEYEIEGGYDYPVEMYSFTPPENGVYVFSSESDYSTQIYIYDGLDNCRDASSGASGENFRLGVPMEAGKTYYLRMEASSDYTITYTLKIKKADSILENHQNDVYVNQGEMVYASCSPSASGFYLFTTNTGNNEKLVIQSYLSSRFYKNEYEKACYLERGEQYAVSCYNSTENDDDDGYVTFFVSPVSTAMGLGENTVRRNPDGRYYATFTPQVSGMYTYTLPSGYGTIDKYAMIGQDNYSAGVLDFDRYNNDYDFNVEMVAGKTYLFYVAFSATAPEEITISVTKKQLPALDIGVNYGVFEGEKRYVAFTPGETGVYAFYNFTNTSFSVKSDVQEMRNSLDGGVYYENYVLQGYVMTEGQEYTFEPEWTASSAVDLTVAQVQEVGLGSTSITKWGYNTFALFTAPETGMYTIGCEGASINKVCVVSDQGFETITERIIKNGKYITVLEKGVTYAVILYCDSADISTLSVSVDHVRELGIGTNEKVFVERKLDYKDNYTYYTFIPDVGGAYNFHMESTGDIIVNARIYERMDTYSPVAYGYWHYWDGTMDIENAILEAGKIYQVAIYTDQRDQDMSVTLTIEPALSYNLEGYSLSLDGSIAVNLYMTLADNIAKSPTAVLHCTFPNGSVVDYKMEDASDKVMNGVKYYVFHLPVAAKEMTGTIRAQIIDEKQDVQGEEYSFSVQDYALTILRGAEYSKEYADAVPLVEALLNYGARAQLYFDCETRDLANYCIAEEKRALPSLSPDSIPHYVKDNQTVQLPQGLTFVGASLSIESETVLTLYFNNNTGKTVTFSEPNSGLSTNGSKSGEYTIVRITGIPAHKLDQTFRLSIAVEGDQNPYFLTYSPIYYCYNVISRDLSETRTKELKDLMTAFYFYNQAAKNYIGEE